MGKNARKRKARDRNRKHPSIESTTSRLHKKESSSSGSEVCSCCGNSLSFDRELSGLGYCAHCSLFFWEPKSKGKQHSLALILSAIRRISGSDMLFSERIPGIVSAILPDIDEGLLEILRRLHKPETESFVEAIRQDEELEEIAISLFVNKSGLDRGKVVTVCNALRRALDKSAIADTDSPISPHNKYILDLSSSSTEVLPGEKIRISWIAADDPRFTYILISDDGPKKVKSNGSVWVNPNPELEVTLKVLYRHQQIDSRKITIKIARPPVIHHLSCNLPTPVMESETLRISWYIENAERVTLIHHYNDYEKLTIDVTDFGGMLSFTALRSELLEIIAERRSLKVAKSIMIDVLPLPKFNVSEIPQFSKFPDMEITRITALTDFSETAKLFDTLRGISSLSGITPYKTLRESLHDLIKFANRIIRQ